MVLIDLQTTTTTMDNINITPPSFKMAFDATDHHQFNMKMGGTASVLLTGTDVLPPRPSTATATFASCNNLCSIFKTFSINFPQTKCREVWVGGTDSPTVSNIYL